MTGIETRLREAAEQGTVARFEAHEVIEAKLIRDILLSVPRGSAAVASPVGLSIEGAFDKNGEIQGTRIRGRILLNDVSISGDGGIAPLTITNCILEGGFSGARSRFASLRFKDCRFCDLPPVDKGLASQVSSAADGAAAETKAHAEGDSLLETENADFGEADFTKDPTIDLGAAALDAGLYMAGITPHRADDYLWIRAAGLRVEGALDVSRSRLRAPPDHRDTRLACEQIVAGIDLTKATIAGDLYGLNGLRCQGCFHARGMHVKGNLWLGGATFEAPGLRALMLQRAVIDGSVMLDERPEWADGSGVHAPVVCAGDLTLRAAKIGGNVDMRGVSIAGVANFSDIEVRNDLRLNGAVRDRTALQGCRVGGSVSLSNLRVGVAFQRLTLRGGTIGRVLRRDASPPNPVLLAARSAALASLPKAQLMETLWKERDDSKIYQVGFLLLKGEWYRLDGFASGLDAVLAKVKFDVATKGHATEFLRLYGTYAQGEAGFPIVDSHDQALRFITPSNTAAIDLVNKLHPDFFKIEEKDEGNTKVVTACVLHGDRLSRYKFMLTVEGHSIKVSKHWLEDGLHVDRRATAHGALITFQHVTEADRINAIKGADWPLPPAALQVARLAKDERDRVQRPLSRQVAAASDLRGYVDLGHLSCDLLKDRGGDGWGPKVYFQLNHFVYRHADWRRDYPKVPGQILEPSLVPRWRQWISRQQSISGTTRHDRSLDDWEGRRSWLFKQYYRPSPRPIDPHTGRPEYPPAPFYSFRKIPDAHYRSQPLEQFAKAARAEGRENAVAHSEMLKRAIEWRSFNRSVRWRMGRFAIIVASAWLMVKKPEPVAIAATFVALLCTLYLMTRGTALRAKFAGFLDRNREEPGYSNRSRRISKLAIWLLYPVPVLIIFGALGWYAKPFHFIVALAIFLAIRMLTTVTHNFLRGCFGYLRRPVRAIITLIVAFIVGWVGMTVANRNEMLVVNAEPVATVVSDAASPARNDHTKSNRLLAGTPRVDHDPATFSHEISCGPVISEPLYALDVLIPIVDLGEERRCEIRRRPRVEVGAHALAPQAERKLPGDMSFGELVRNIPELTIGSRRFWWWVIALYAIAGWIIVSLSILTFAHAMRAHAEPPMEHK